MTETTYETYETDETDVDRFRRQLFMLAAEIEKHFAKTTYDSDERLDWLDLQQMTHDLAGTVGRYIYVGEADAQRPTPWYGKR
jgi:hypothetical protein